MEEGKMRLVRIPLILSLHCLALLFSSLSLSVNSFQSFALFTLQLNHSETTEKHTTQRERRERGKDRG
jgi:hypothetical protein